MINAYKVLVSKPELVLARSRGRCYDNIKIDVMETMWEVVDWIHLEQDRNRWQAGSYYRNKTWDFIKGVGFLDQLSNFYLLK
jgi:hypothetical protein